jgi:uncharacterized membrane protein YcaP (DUF421 family)
VVPGLGSDPIDIVVRTTVVYAFVIAVLRFGGKREVGQLGIVDLVALLLLANAVQNAMVGSDSSLGGGLLAAAVIVALALLLDRAMARSRLVRHLLVGESRVLILNGRVNRRAMEHEHISEDEMQEALHEHGLQYRREVKRATLEVDGSISIIPQPEASDRYQAGGGPDTAARRAGRIPRRSSRQSLTGGSDGALAAAPDTADEDRPPEAAAAAAPETGTDAAATNAPEPTPAKEIAP